MSDHQAPEKDDKSKASDPAELLKSLISSQPDGAAKQPVEPPRKSAKQFSAAPDVVAKKQPTDQPKQRLDRPNTPAKKRQISWPMGDKLSLYSLVVGILSLVVAIIALPQFASVRPLSRPLLAYETKTTITCPGGLALPQSVDPLHLSPETQDIIQKSLKDFSVLPPVAPLGYFYSNISNTAQDSTQIAIESKISVSVRRSEIPDVINVISYGGCGAGGYQSIIYGIDLGSDKSTPNRTIEYGDSSVDYFTLQPGETTPFKFYFGCDDPGAYSVDIEINYSYLGYSHTAKIIENKTIVCPKHFQRWNVYLNDTWKTGVLTKHTWISGHIDKLDIYSDPIETSKIIAKITDEKAITLFGDYTATKGKIWAHIKVNATGAEGWAISR